MFGLTVEAFSERIIDEGFNLRKISQRYDSWVLDDVAVGEDTTFSAAADTGATGPS